MGYSWFGFFNNDEHALKYWQNDIDNQVLLYGTYKNFSFICFGWYPGSYYSRGNRNEFYCSFQMKPWYESSINEFNQKFKHLHIDIVKEYEYGAYNNPYSGLEYITDIKLIKNVRRVVLFHIQIDPAYGRGARYALPVLLGTFIRMNRNLIEEQQYGDSIAHIIHYNNTVTRIQESSMSYFALQEETFYRLDNVELMNSLFDKQYYVKYSFGSYPMSSNEYVGVGYKVYPSNYYELLEGKATIYDTEKLKQDRYMPDSSWLNQEGQYGDGRSVPSMYEATGE